MCMNNLTLWVLDSLTQILCHTRGAARHSQACTHPCDKRSAKICHSSRALFNSRDVRSVGPRGQEIATKKTLTEVREKDSHTTDSMIWHDSTYSPQATMLCWLDQSDKKAFLRRLWPPVDIQLWLHCYGCYVSYAWQQQLKSLIPRPRTLTQGRPSIFRHASSQILDSQTLEIRVPEVWFIATA